MREVERDLHVEATALLRQACAAAERVPVLRAVASDLLERAKSISERKHTVALFGAFSAGKSSIANALMGEAILPSSPHPTTAAICRIVPPEGGLAHREARVRYKTRSELLEDVNRSLDVLDHRAHTWEEALELIQPLASTTSVSESARPHLAFLAAVKRGCAEVEGRLGTEERVAHDVFRRLVTQEEYACFVESADIAVDCAWTRAGVVLVDTPGVDSLNARHTGVAFEYIRQADAILYVTYYNHAFSRADSRFLEQLGRMKSVFALDKMFFIVNAADLASSEEELDGVVSHVRKSLISHGIASPRLYALSSQTALLARMAGKGALTPSAQKAYRARLRLPEEAPLPSEDEAVDRSGVGGLVRAFERFLQNDVTALTVREAYGELLHAAQLAERVLNEATADAGTREARLKDLEAIAQRATQRVRTEGVESILPAVVHELDELFFHSEQRCFFDFPRRFAESFNPSVLREDRGSMRDLLKEAAEDLLRETHARLADMLRATLALMDRHANELLHRWRDQLAEQIQSEFTELSPGPPIHMRSGTVSDVPAFPDDLRTALLAASRDFKSPRHFFEEGGRKSVEQGIEGVLRPAVAEWFAAAKGELAKDLELRMREWVMQEREHLTARIVQTVDGVRETLSAAGPAEDLAAALVSLQDLAGQLSESLDASGSGVLRM